jgi:hypothetical protein
METYKKYLRESLMDSVNEEASVDEYWSDVLELAFELIDTLDYDSLTEDQQDLVDEFMDMTDEDTSTDEEPVEEAMKMVVRAGKRMKIRTCPAGMKALNGKCIKMSSAEKRARAKGQKAGARKRKAGSKMAARKRAKSMAKRR